MNRSIFDNTTAQFLGRIVLIVGVVGFFWLLWQIADILLLGFAGALLGVFFSILMTLLQRFAPLSNQWALFVVLLVLLVLLALLSWFLAPRLLQDINALLDNVPAALQQFTEQIDQYGWTQRLLDRLPPLSQVVAPSGSFVSRVTGTFSTLFQIGANLLLIFFVGVFLAANPRLYREGLLQLVPDPRHPRIGAVLDEVVITLRWWILGQLFSMSVIGVFTGVGLWLLGMPFALALGVIAGVLEFVPYIGPIFSGVLAALLAFAQSPIQALYVLLLYIAIQQFESNILTPLVHQYTVSLPPALTLILVLALGTLFGFVGVLVATPLLAIGIVLIKMLYIEDVLGREADLPRKLFQRKPS